MNAELTEQEQNLIKDILQVIANRRPVTEAILKKTNLSFEDYDNLAESIFNKLGNGRVTFVES